MKKYMPFLVLIVVAGVAGFFWTKNKTAGDKPQIESGLAPSATVPTSKPAPNYPTTVGNFLVTENEICKKDGKPIIYFFGSSSCPHCVWEKPIIEKVAGNFGSQIDFHKNMDSQEDGDVFAKYGNINPGYVPFFVFGCKYARVGAGENLGKDDTESKKLEEEALTAILCKLTDGKPSSVCNPLKSKISEVK